MIDPQAGRQLLYVARKTLTQFLAYGERANPDESALPPALVRHASSFVTLYNCRDRDDVERLRGCIGTTHGRLPLVQDVAHNIIAAARDPRFLPVAAAELPDLAIQISILHPPVQLDYVNYDQLLTMLRPGVDGVIISWRNRKALLLPQVWDRFATPHAFLQALAHKARIPLQTFYAAPPEVAVFTFETTTFSERDATPISPKDSEESGNNI